MEKAKKQNLFFGALLVTVVTLSNVINSKSCHSVPYNSLNELMSISQCQAEPTSLDSTDVADPAPFSIVPIGDDLTEEEYFEILRRTR